MQTTMTKTELQQRLKKADVMFRTKAPKAELEKLLANSQKPNGHATSKKKTNAKRPLGAKATLREKFTQSGVVTSKQIDNIAANSNVTRATVLTALSDLKNPKYAGQAGPLAIEKSGDEYRLAK